MVFIGYSNWIDHFTSMRIHLVLKSFMIVRPGLYCIVHVLRGHDFKNVQEEHHGHNYIVARFAMRFFILYVDVEFSKCKALD